MRGFPVLLLGFMLAQSPAHALTLGVAVMDARSVGLPDADVKALEAQVRTLTEEGIKGTRFTLSDVAELRKVLADMPGCKVGTCDMQVAKRSGSVVVLSLEATLVKNEHALALRLFETREGAQLARALPAAPSLKELQKLVPAAVAGLVDALKQSHAAAVAAMKAGEKRYLLLPPGPAAVASVTQPAPLTQGRRLIEDGESVHMEEALRPVRADFNACYRAVLSGKPSAQGRVVVSADVETDGSVSHVDIVEDQILNAQMQACISGRVKRMKFMALERPWRIRFPLVFVPAR